MHIRIADFVFHSGDLPSLSGFTVSSLTGWTGGPGVKRDSSPRQGAAGSHNVKGFSVDRVPVFRGLYHGSSLDDVQYMNDALTGLESLEQRVTVTWPDTKWVDAHVDRVRFEPAGYKAEAEYQIELWVPDSYKYGETRQFVTSTDATVTAYHRGNTASVPRFTVAGTFPSGYALHSQGRVVQVAGSASAISDVVDFRTGMVTRGGAYLPALLQQGQFWGIPGGSNTSWRLDRVGGTGTATAHVTDTYL